MRSLLVCGLMLTATILPIGKPAALGAAAPPQSARPVGATEEAAAAISEASRRFGIPEAWIRSVIQVESAGDPAAVSSAGALGLMQIMPSTYAELAAQLGLGRDPFLIRDNILAGVAYLRRMYDRFGSPGFLAAYNAGPGRWRDYQSRGRTLPRETQLYLARLGPRVGAVLNEQSSAPRPVASSPFGSPIFVERASVMSASPGRQELAQTDAGEAADQPVDGLFPRSLVTSRNHPEPSSGVSRSARNATIDRELRLPAATSRAPIFAPPSASSSQP